MRPDELETCRVVAYSLRSNQYLGTIADLSHESLILLTDSPIKPGTVIELRLECSDQRPALDGIELGVQARWCDDHAGAYWIGLSVISVEPLVKERLAGLKNRPGPSDDAKEYSSPDDSQLVLA